MLAEIAIRITAAMALEITALVIIGMISFWALHEATAVWDATYGHHRRKVTPIEQWMHSYLGVLPLMALALVVVLNRGQFLALFGMGTEEPRFDINWKHPPLPLTYVLSIMTAVVVFELLPYLEEFARGLRANGGRLVPTKSKPLSTERRVDCGQEAHDHCQAR
jgi:hypothetical protein